MKQKREDRNEKIIRGLMKLPPDRRCINCNTLLWNAFGGSNDHFTFESLGPNNLMQQAAYKPPSPVDQNSSLNIVECEYQWIGNDDISWFLVCGKVYIYINPCLRHFRGSVRVSNELGRGRSKAAKFSIVVTVLTSLAVGIVLFMIFLFAKGNLAYTFTVSAEVEAAIADLSPLLAFSILLNSIQPVLSGVAVGAGWKSTVAYINIACYYLIGIPVGAVLGYVFNLQVKGVWIGMLFGTIALVIITWKTDWDKQVISARACVNKWLVPESKELNPNTGKA